MVTSYEKKKKVPFQWFHINTSLLKLLVCYVFQNHFTCFPCKHIWLSVGTISHSMSSFAWRHVKVALFPKSDLIRVRLGTEWHKHAGATWCHVTLKRHKARNAIYLFFFLSRAHFKMMPYRQWRHQEKDLSWGNLHLSTIKSLKTGQQAHGCFSWLRV